MEDGAWMLWENSSVAAVAAAVAVAAVAHPDLGSGHTNAEYQLQKKVAYMNPNKNSFPCESPILFPI